MQSKFVPTAECPTYASYRAAKMREYRTAWKKRNAEVYAEMERVRRTRKYAMDEGHREGCIARATATYIANPEPAKARSRQSRKDNAAAHKIYDRQYYLANKAALHAYRGAWASAHPYYGAARGAARRAAKLRATPPWYEVEAIKDVYKEARYFGMHVDHIVPLIHPLVCGLHVWENLQLLNPTDNYSKGNKFTVGTQHAY